MGLLKLDEILVVFTLRLILMIASWIQIAKIVKQN